MRRLSTSLLIAVLISIIGVGWLMDRLFVRLNTSNRDSINVSIGLGEMLVGIVNSSEQSLIDSLATTDLSDYSVSIINTDDIGLPESLQSALKEGEPLILESDLNLALYFTLKDPERILMIRLPPDGGESTHLRLLLTLSFYALVAVLLLVWLYPLVRRLRLLAAVAKRFGEGDLQQRVATSPDSSLYDIESEFNSMAQRLQGLVEDNKMLSGAVSHDLRTPVARLRFGIDALQEQIEVLKTDPAARSRVDDYLARINSDLASMEQLVEALLEFARLDQQLSELPLAPVNLARIVHECAESYTLNTARKIQIDIAYPEAIVMADERYTSMLVSNLIQNATKFSIENVYISLLETDNIYSTSHVNLQPANSDSKKIGSEVKSYSLIVEDDGPGFDMSSIERLTKPFEKGTATTGQGAAKSYGLGLAIVARIVQWFSASIKFGVSEELGGAKVSVAIDALH